MGTTGGYGSMSRGQEYAKVIEPEEPDSEFSRKAQEALNEYGGSGISVLLVVLVEN